MFGLNPLELVIIGAVAIATFVLPVLAVGVVIWFMLGAKKDRSSE